MVSKTKTYFSNLSDKIKTSVRVKIEAPFFYLALALIVLIAVLIRLTPVFNDTFLIKAFDPWFQYDSTKYLINHGWHDYLTAKDYKFWYPEGVDRTRLRPGLIFSGALFYYLLTGLGIEVSIMESCFYFPVVLGAITIIVMYYLGKEIMDEKTGLIAAFFLAISPGHMQRTVAGFYDNETIGVLGVLLILLFYIKAVKSGRFLHSLTAGLALGYLALSWGGLTFPFLLVPLLTGIMILSNNYNSKILIAYTGTIGVGELVYMLNSFFPWNSMIKSMDFIVPLLFFLVLVVYHLIFMNKGSKLYENVFKLIKWGSIPAIVTVAIIFWIKPEIIPFSLASRLESILNPNIREEINLVASVGEHMPSPWSVFYYNTLVSLLFVIPGIYFAARRGNIEDILMIVFVITLYYFTGSMIRIILLFSPAVSLLGAFGLSNLLKYFGNLMKKEKMITRRRKRQLKRTLGRPEGIVVYAIIATLLMIQVNHGATISSNQLGYSELVAGGYYHDWEETLTWMQQNIDPYDPVVSWWDYGYWISAVGNSTSVNDNGTWNNTRIGMTGMAMMQTNERYSAEIFRQLGAKYVLVYFGHLINGLGGDEGKWPWMLRICNDHSQIYYEQGLYRDNWYSEDQVFNEDEFINGTSGGYENKWFEATIVKLMFADEATSVSSAQTPTEAYYASEIEGYEAENKSPREDDNGNLWSTHIPTNGQYNFQFFKPTYYSSNKLVKIFEVDYTALDAAFEVEDARLDDNGLGYAKITNTGDLELSIADLSIDGQDFNFTAELPESSFSSGESRYVWFDTTEVPGFIENEDDTFNITVAATVTKDNGDTYTFTNASTDKVISEASDASIKIDRAESYMEITETDESDAYITIENTGTRPVKIGDFYIDNDWVNTTDVFNDINGNFLIAPGESETYYIGTTIGVSPDLNGAVSVRCETIDGGIDETVFGFNKEDYRLDIISDSGLQIRPEDKYLYDYTDYDEINPLTNRYYISNDSQSYLSEDGDLVLKVQNNGEKKVAFQSVFVNGDSVEFSVDGGDSAYFLENGDVRTIRATISDVERNSPMEIIVTAESQGTVASDVAYIIPHNDSSMISIINNTNSFTTVFANETGRLVVKNVGKQTVQLNQIIINNGTTPTFDIQNSWVIDGDNPGSKTLNPNEVAVLEYSISGIKINLTDVVNVRVTTTSANVLSEKEIVAIQATKISNLSFFTPDSTTYLDHGSTNADYISDDIHLALALYFNSSVNIDAVWVKMADDDPYQYVPLSEMTLKDNEIPTQNTITGWEISIEGDEFGIYYIDFNILTALGIDLEDEDQVWVKIITLEGYEDEVILTASD